MEINEGLKWIIGTIITLGGLLGISKLLENKQSRGFAMSDRAIDITSANFGKQLDADSQFTQNLINRLDKLENEQREMQDKLLKQAVTTARTEEENKHLKETNIRQETEINGLREDRKKDGIKIINLENELHRTQEELKKAQGLIKDLSDRFERLNTAR